MNDKHLPDDERDAYRAFIERGRAFYDINRPSGRDMATVLRTWLEVEPGNWPRVVLDDAQVDGLWKAFSKQLKAQDVVMVSHDGQIVGKTVRVGTRTRRTDGSEVWQQSLLHEKTWAQVEQWLEQIVAQLGAMLVNKSMADRLLALRDRFPESLGPADACTALGTTVDEYLGVAA